MAQSRADQVQQPVTAHFPPQGWGESRRLVPRRPDVAPLKQARDHPQSSSRDVPDFPNLPNGIERSCCVNHIIADATTQNRGIGYYDSMPAVELSGGAADMQSPTTSCMGCAIRTGQ